MDKWIDKPINGSMGDYKQYIIQFPYQLHERIPFVLFPNRTPPMMFEGLEYYEIEQPNNYIN